MVLDPVAVVEEIEGLRAKKIKVGKNLLISDCAHLVLPYHRALDAARESAMGRAKIGTTGRGIGPAYGDKIARTGLRMADLVQPARFTEKLKPLMAENNARLKAAGQKPLSFKQVNETYLEAGEKLAPHVTDTVMYLHRAMQSGKELLFEGAQGTFLDIDHGTYPYVTSSNTTAGGASTGSGVPPHRMDKVLGVIKAYTTRVGEGPFPTESAEMSDMLHAMGREYGATTGRARRCGWFDAAAVRYAGIVNGIDELAVTNVDGLDSLETLRICVGYKLGRKKLEVPPSDHRLLAECEPAYIEMPGWRTPTEDIRRFRDLPGNCRAYLNRLADLSSARLSIVSVGPGRDQTMVLGS